METRKKRSIAQLLALCISGLLAISQVSAQYNTYQCPTDSPAWLGPYEVFFNYGTNCECYGSAKYCIRVVGGQLEYHVGAVAYDLGCEGHSEAAFVHAVRSAVWQNPEDDAAGGALNIPPCGAI